MPSSREGGARPPAVRCYTRALKNARHLQAVAPEIFARDPNAEGFGTGVPLEILRGLHRMPHHSPALNRHKAVAEILRKNPPPVPGRASRDALFSGTIHFAQVTFATSHGDLVVPTADMNQIVQYAQRAIVPISGYAEQYGANAVTVSPALLTATVTLHGTSFSDGDLQGWVNDLASSNGFGSDHCIFVPVPPGVSAADVGENAGYHGKANIPYVVAGVTTGLTLDDTADVYAMVVSHESAEMIVDPNVDGHNPEVCDPCDLNCNNLTRCYFDASDNFLGSNQASPPGGFAFTYYTCAVVQAAAAADCPAPSANCQYPPTVQASGVVSRHMVAAVVPGTDVLQLFYRGQDNGVWSRWRNPDGSWSGEQSLGGVLTSDITAAVVPGTDVLQLFYRGQDNGVWSRWRNPDGSWSGEQSLGGVLTSDITAAVLPGTDVLQLFYRGQDNGVWSRWRNPDGSWSGEQSLGGILTSDITAAVVPGTDVLQLFYKGQDNGVWSRWRNPDGSWSGEQGLGGVLTSDITAAVLPGSDVLQLFYRGQDNGVWSRWRNPDGSWSGEQGLGGILISDVTAAVVPGTDSLQLFYRGLDNGVWSRWRNPDGSWSGEQGLGGILTSDVTAAVLPGTDVLQLFYRGLNSGVWSRWRNSDGSWSGEQGLGGILS